MSVLIATIVLTSLIMLATIAIVIISTRFSANREQRWLDWSRQHGQIDYQSRKFIDQRQQHDWTQLLQYQHRFVAHWLENQLNQNELMTNNESSLESNKLPKADMTAGEITANSTQWLDHNWRYFECSLLIGNRMKTQSIILITCHIPGASPWLINHQIHDYPDAFHNATPTTLSSVNKQDLPNTLRNTCIQAERPHFVRQVFSNDVIGWIQNHPKLSVGWIQNTLIVYRLGQVINPDYLPNAVEEVLLLKQYLQAVKNITEDDN